MLPENAKKVFKGEIFDVYQWPQKMFDNSIEIFEKISRPDTVEIIATTHDRKIIIQEQLQPDSEKAFLSVVGGRVDQGEEHLQAAKREMLEETGYLSEDWSMYFKETPSRKLIWDVYVYIARNVYKKTEQKLDVGEKIDLMFVEMDEFLDLVDRGKLKRMSPELRVKCIRSKYDRGTKADLEKHFFGG